MSKPIPQVPESSDELLSASGSEVRIVNASSMFSDEANFLQRQLGQFLQPTMRLRDQPTYHNPPTTPFVVLPSA